jgi:hypothetical protein
MNVRSNWSEGNGPLDAKRVLLRHVVTRGHSVHSCKCSNMSTSGRGICCVQRNRQEVRDETELKTSTGHTTCPAARTGELLTQ